MLNQQKIVFFRCYIVRIKTMYQKFKRTRGGLVILLAYSGTSEERKVDRLMNTILKRYPWSTAILDSVGEKLG